MAEEVKVINWPDGGSVDRVAFDLWNALRQTMPKDELEYPAVVAKELELFVQCRRATRGAATDISGLA